MRSSTALLKRMQELLPFPDVSLVFRPSWLLHEDPRFFFFFFFSKDDSCFFCMGLKKKVAHANRHPEKDLKADSIPWNSLMGPDPAAVARTEMIKAIVT